MNQDKVETGRPDHKKLNLDGIQDVMIGLLVAGLTSGMLYFSVRPIFFDEYLKKQRIPLKPELLSYGVGFFMCFLFIMLLLSLIRRRTLSIAFFSVLILLLSVVNYYEFLLRGTVFTYDDLHNASTAVRMLKQVDLKLTKEISAILILFLFLALLTVLCGIYEKRNGLKARNIRMFFEWAVLAGSLFVLCFLTGKVIPRADPWSWQELYARRGYVTGSISYILTNLHSPIRKPEGYDEAVLPMEGGEKTGQMTGDKPDIVLILNETWYDLQHLSDITTDRDCMENYKKLDAIKGYAVVPIAGGGTNNSEYELLTANSMTLINTYSPFIYLDIDPEGAVTGYLKDCGYYLAAVHSEKGTNYNRNQIWPDLGFDAIHFGEDFTGLEYYGKRERATDSSVFRSVRSFYEEMPEEKPRFLFWLTIQNHGGWNINPPELDTVHVTGDFEKGSVDLTDSLDMENEEELKGVMNEYLSSVSLTDGFIDELTSYFKDIYEDTGRKVIVCMAGDHSPEFVHYLKSPSDPEEEHDLRKREVPFFIWKNYRDENKDPSGESAGIFDLCCLTPYVFQEAGLPMTAYYQRLSELGKTARCFTNVYSKAGEMAYVDQNGSIQSAFDGTEQSDKVKEYFYMEYDRISQDPDDPIGSR